jgi:hypothetical protein
MARWRIQPGILKGYDEKIAGKEVILTISRVASMKAHY